ncbi:MAG: hypothetical protein Aurels2KO_29620 [Aureliella sp.]
MTLEPSKERLVMASLRTQTYQSAAVGPTTGARLPRRGTGLVEVTVATAIVATLLLTSVNSVFFVLSNRKAGAEHGVANAIFSELAREANARAFHSGEQVALLGRDGEGSNSRMKLDDFDDFGDLELTVITDEDDRVIDLFGGWQLSTRGDYIDFHGSVQVTPGDLKRVGITLTAPSGKQYEYFLLRCVGGYMIDRSNAPEALFSATIQTRNGDISVRENSIRIGGNGGE